MSKRKLIAEDLLRMSFVADVQVHPDQERAICVVKRAKGPGSYESQLYELSPKKEPRCITQGGYLDSAPRWSPDGSQLAFLSNREKPRPGLFILEDRLAEPRKLVELGEGTISDYQWSPNGQRIAYLYRRKAEGWTTADAEKRKAEDRSELPRIIETWPYRLDGDGYYDGEVFELYVLDVVTKKSKKVLGKTDLGEIEFCWAPNSEDIAVAYRTGRQRYLQPPGNDVWIVNVATRKRTALKTPRGEKSALSWSPDGRTIAFIFDRREEEPWGPKSEGIGFITVSNGEFREALPSGEFFIQSHVIGDSRDPAPTRLFWSPDSKSITFQLGAEGQQKVVQLTQGGKLKVLTANLRGEVHLTSMSNNGKRFGGAHTTPTRPNEAILMRDGVSGFRVEGVSDFNGAWLKEVSIAPLRSLRVTSQDGTKIQAWVLRHPSQRKQPAVIEVHGGPMAMYTEAFFFEMQLLAARGFSVFFSNPRGSTGYGEAFCRAIMGNWGELDWQDVQALLKSVKEQSYVDGRRISIAGGSYGGFMVNWAIGHTHEFYRAVTDRCVSNLLSKWGNSDYLFVPDGHWPGTAFRNWERLWECSPIKHFAEVKTPTLIIHSEGDLRCAIEQGEQVYAALKILGVETKFIRYPPSTSHGMSRGGPPDLRIHRLNAIVDWLTH